MPLLHNRLTHSEKVAQVARSIAEAKILSANETTQKLVQKLGGFDLDVCEAAALAHDLGHPPFGHIGEKILDDVARNKEILDLDDGFEGNAQSLRILVIGKIRSNKYEGNNPTYATIAAVSKYPWKRAGKRADHDEIIDTDSEYRKHWKKFSAYDPQYELLTQAREFLPPCISEKEIQSLEASVMDVADDITYAVHDLEDFYLAGILDVSWIREDLEKYIRGEQKTGDVFFELASRLGVDYSGWFNDDEMIRAAEWAERELKSGFNRRQVNYSEVEAQARKRGSDFIDTFINAIEVRDEPFWTGGPYVGLDERNWHRVQILKEITRSYVVQRPDIALLQRGQQEVLEKFVKLLYEWSENDRARLPARLKREIEIAEEQLDGGSTIGYGKDQHAPRGKNKNRAILDYICTLTDLECLQIYYKLSGIQVHRPGMVSF